MFSFLKQAGIVVHFLSLLIVIRLLLWINKETGFNEYIALSEKGIRYNKLPVFHRFMHIVMDMINILLYKYIYFYANMCTNTV